VFHPEKSGQVLTAEKKVKQMKRVVFVLLICLVMFPLVLMAQPGNPEDPPIPIDGGLLYLLLGGIVLGVKKLMDMRKGK
jgi:hypothetical protein